MDRVYLTADEIDSLFDVLGDTPVSLALLVHIEGLINDHRAEAVVIADLGRTGPTE